MEQAKKKRISDEVFTIIIFSVLFLAVFFTFAMLNKNFASVINILNILKHVSVVAIAALGLTFVIAVDHADISFYMSSCFSAMLMAWLIAKGWHPVVCILAGIVAGCCWGLVSGIAVGKFKLPDKISTIAIGSIAFGAAYLFSDGAFIYTNFPSSGITSLNNARIVGIPLPVIIMLALYFLAYMVLERSKYGRQFYAIGANRKAAFFSGINVNKVIVISFVICGGMAAMAAMITTAAQGNGNVQSGLTLLMPCFSAVFIGNAVFRKPSVIGTFLGAVFTSMVQNGFTLMSVPFYISDLVVALLLIVAILSSKFELSSVGKKSAAAKGKAVAAQ